jgi:pimeloyl-ACP methyl ester carboxylesterase
VLVSHSQSGIYPFQTAMLNSRGIAGIVAIEPGACPDARADMTPFTKMPILVLWGDYVNLSSRWSPRLTACKAFVEAVAKAGGTIENVVLPEIGIRGNSHMLMQDKNNLEIADWLLAWIDRNVKTRTQK